MISVVLLTVLLSTSAPAGTPWEDHGRLAVSANGRFLQHHDGTPFLWIGDTGWALFYKLPRPPAVGYQLFWLRC